MNLLAHRKAIDKLDAQIVKLLNQRTRHVLEIGAIKRQADEEIYAPHRERAVFQRVFKLNRGPIKEESLRAIYREIMSGALSLEKSMTIAYLGPETTFTHQAAVRRFGASLRYVAQPTIADVFSEVSRSQADYGVVPVENSTEGVVTNTLDVFVASELKIVSQILLPIYHCLVGRCPRAQIKKVYLHPQASAQCRDWVRDQLPQAEIIETSSSARAVDLAAREPFSAAVAGPLAAERHSLPVLEDRIEGTAAVVSRFLVLGRQCSPRTGDDRTTLVLGVAPGTEALQRALVPFRRYRLKMTQIESHPNKGNGGGVLLFVDCKGHATDKPLAKAIAQLNQECNYVKVLGSYPNSD